MTIKLCLSDFKMASFNFDPRGRRAIITGGAQGLGLEFARQLLGHGAKVCICDINTSLGEEAVKQLKDDYGVKKDG